MKKLSALPLFHGVFPALMPLLFQTLDWRWAFLLGGLVTFTFWATVFFFSATRAYFPKPLVFIAPILWIVTFAQCGYYFGLNPLWAVSLFLLLPFSLVKPTSRRFPKETADFFWIRQGLIFWGLLLSIGILQELLGRKLGLFIFREPAGSWMLLGFAALFMKETTR